MKPHLLLLHGALGSKSQFDALIPLLNTQYHTHSFDFSGHGADCYDNELSMELFCEDILRYMEKNQISECTLFGYSMGGYAALNFVGKHPERVNRIMTLGTKWAWSPDAAAREAAMLDPEIMMAKVPAFAEMLDKRHNGQGWKKLVYRTRELMHRLGESGEYDPGFLHSIQIPVLICVGSLDKMVSLEESDYVSKQIPNGNFKILDSTPHPLEKVDMHILAEEIKAFSNFYNK
ncbi:MAG: alpha/beta hydrolase [Saprospiraceae bacterium]|nr:alpha/beta hydrolase [Saprospiraceae bacterium]